MNDMIEKINDIIRGAVMMSFSVVLICITNRVKMKYGVDGAFLTLTSGLVGWAGSAFYITYTLLEIRDIKNKK